MENGFQHKPRPLRGPSLSAPDAGALMSLRAAGQGTAEIRRVIMLTKAEQGILAEACRVSKITKASIEQVLDSFEDIMKEENPAIIGIVFRIKNHIAVLRQEISIA